MSKFLERCHPQGITLNKDKCKLKMKSVSFMGHIVTEKGMEVDPIKMQAVNDFPTPQNVSQLKNVFGFVKFLF